MHTNWDNMIMRLQVPTRQLQLIKALKELTMLKVLH